MTLLQIGVTSGVRCDEPLSLMTRLHCCSRAAGCISQRTDGHRLEYKQEPCGSSLNMTVPKGATAVVGGVQSLPRRVEHFRAPTHRHAMAPLTHPAIIQTLEESVKTKRAAAGRGTAAAGRGTQELLTGVSRSFWQGGHYWFRVLCRVGAGSKVSI